MSDLHYVASLYLCFLLPIQPVTPKDGVPDRVSRALTETAASWKSLLNLKDDSTNSNANNGLGADSRSSKSKSPKQPSTTAQQQQPRPVPSNGDMQGSHEVNALLWALNHFDRILKCMHRYAACQLFSLCNNTRSVHVRQVSSHSCCKLPNVPYVISVCSVS